MNKSRFYLPYLKPLLDYIIVLIILAPCTLLFLFIMMTYTVMGQFPIFFQQERIGKNGKPFLLCKFRTLSLDVDKTLHQRKFFLGNFLRATNLDELPQLWNVLCGDMSLVGPRPLPVEYAHLFSIEQNKRHTVLPGITGLAQVNGKNNISWDKKFKLDIKYVEKVSLILDGKILCKTLILALSFSKDNSLSEEKFTG